MENQEPTPDPDEGLNLEDLRAMHENYRKALQEEFSTQGAETELAAVEGTLSFFRKNARDAAMQIVYLMNNAGSDGVRFQASKYLIECLLRGAVDSKADPVSELIKDLQRQ